METLRAAGIPVEAVPGITSGIAVPESVGIPVTHRDFASSVTFITGHEDPKKEVSSIDWEWLAKSPGTVVIYMGVRNIPVIAEKLIGNGMSAETKVAVIENGFRENQRVTCTTLLELPAKAAEVGFQAPAVIVIGNVVSLYRG